MGEIFHFLRNPVATFLNQFVLRHSTVCIRFPTVLRLHMLPAGLTAHLTFVLISDLFDHDNLGVLKSVYPTHVAQLPCSTWWKCV